MSILDRIRAHMRIMGKGVSAAHVAVIIHNWGWDMRPTEGY